MEPDTFSAENLNVVCHRGKFKDTQDELIKYVTGRLDNIGHKRFSLIQTPEVRLTFQLVC